ncbi:MAG: transcription repressor NadR [Clostridiales bacterium]|nr:transcription repressor NadR [Clostridiales bacterium]
MKNVLTAEKRRAALIDCLTAADSPVSASALAAQFSVSRQVIVGDIALLRASGANISATPRGYVIDRAQQGCRRTVACVHSCEDTAKELNIMVDNGCTVVDVIVEHPIYGQISGRLDLASRYDVAQFVEKLSSEEAPPLSSLTGGVHLHTLICPDEAAYRRVCKELSKEKLLFSE